MQRTISLFKPIYNTHEALKAIGRVLDSGWTGYGSESKNFEENWKLYSQFPHAHFLNSATSGLHLALECIKSKMNPYWEHDRVPVVATTPLTFVSTNHVIKYMRWSYDFIDIEEHSLCMNPSLLESEIRKGAKYAAVIFVGIGGNVGELKRISAICKGANIPLILDASHMAGTHWKENPIHVGVNDADYTIFSFQSVKNLPTADSGMICCRDCSDDALVRKLSWLGISKDTHSRTKEGGNWYYDVPFVGYKYQGNDVMAAIANVQLNELEANNLLRRTQARMYALGLPEIFIKHSDDCFSSYHLAQIKVNHEATRDNLIHHCRDKGIQLGVHYRNNTEFPMYQDQLTLCPVADKTWKRIASLPIGPHLLPTDVNYVIEVIYEYLA